ncbi:MAG: endonuclease NucS [Candidatus Nezhaarchaeales archaeon]
MRIFKGLETDNAYLELKTSLANNESVIIVGDCEVEYYGRASSTLTRGERVVMIKQDGSILVHRPEGYEPVNWQPPGCLFKVDSLNGLLKIVATRLSPHEVLTISFHKVYVMVCGRLYDKGIFSMHASEDEMKEAIRLNPSLIEEGLRILTSEKDLGEAGYADFVGEDSKGNFVVIEIKREVAGEEEVLQLARYVNEAKQRVNRPVRGVLVAPSLRRRGQVLLEQLKLEFKALTPESCKRFLKKVPRLSLLEFME